MIVPTRELATQVGEDLGLAASRRSVRVTTIYGGRAYEPQVDELNRGTEVVVGTPGRLIDLMRQRHLSFDHVQTVVLDETDEMLDLGFLPDVETLLQAVPDKRQTMLFSATMPGPVVAMARRFMTHPTHIRAEDPDDTQATKKDIRQLIYRAHHLDKDELIARVLQARERGRTIIFTRTKRAAARLTDELTRRGFAAGAIHGDLGQGAREQALRAFRNEKIDVLVATDVAARGIDVDDVTHVINFQCPEDEKTYLHRIGRTGRAGHKGTAVTLVDWEDIPQWKLIAASLGLDQTEPIETYSASPTCSKTWISQREPKENSQSHNALTLVSTPKIVKILVVRILDRGPAMVDSIVADAPGVVRLDTSKTRAKNGLPRRSTRPRPRRRRPRVLRGGVSALAGRTVKWFPREGNRAQTSRTTAISRCATAPGVLSSLEAPAL